MKSIYDCELIEQSEVSEGVWLARLMGPQIARDVTAGQFVNVQVSKSTDPLLRRPFSVHAAYPDVGEFSLLYVVIGRGTRILQAIPTGEKISVVGPLGTGFDLGDQPGAEHIVVAGGCGAAPLHFLCDALCDKWGCDNVTVLAGGRNKEAVLCEEEFRSHGVGIEVATDDGSYGYGGFVTELLSNVLAQRKGKESTIRVYSCGPHAMMREVARICHDNTVANCQVSLENNMACGIGVCTGCVQKLKTHSSAQGWEYKRVCKDGPVFNAEDVIWE